MRQLPTEAANWVEHRQLGRARLDRVSDDDDSGSTWAEWQAKLPWNALSPSPPPPSNVLQGSSVWSALRVPLASTALLIFIVVIITKCILARATTSNDTPRSPMRAKAFAGSPDTALHASAATPSASSPQVASGLSGRTRVASGRTACTHTPRDCTSPHLLRPSPPTVPTSWSMSRLSRALAPPRGTYHPSRYTPVVNRPVRQVVSGGGTWFEDGPIPIDIDGSPRLSTSAHAPFDRDARGVAWDRTPKSSRCLARGLLVHNEQYSIDDANRAGPSPAAGLLALRGPHGPHGCVAITPFAPPVRETPRSALLKAQRVSYLKGMAAARQAEQARQAEPRHRGREAHSAGRSSRHSRSGGHRFVSYPPSMSPAGGFAAPDASAVSTVVDALASTPAADAWALASARDGAQNGARDGVQSLQLGSSSSDLDGEISGALGSVELRDVRAGMRAHRHGHGPLHMPTQVPARARVNPDAHADAVAHASPILVPEPVPMHTSKEAFPAISRPCASRCTTIMHVPILPILLDLPSMRVPCLPCLP